MLIVDKSQPSPADIKGWVCHQSSKEKVHQLSFKTGNLPSYYRSRVFAEKMKVNFEMCFWCLRFFPKNERKQLLT